MFEIIKCYSSLQKGCTYLKNNYRPVNILSISSKLSERLISKQLTEFFDNIFSKFHCFLMVLETWKEVTDKKSFGAFLKDLSKAFNCFSHNILIAKLHAYDLDLVTLNTNRI